MIKYKIVHEVIGRYIEETIVNVEPKYNCPYHLWSSIVICLFKI